MEQSPNSRYKNLIIILLLYILLLYISLSIISDNNTIVI